jgi:hypothetical protein
LLCTICANNKESLNIVLKIKAVERLPKITGKINNPIDLPKLEKKGTSFIIKAPKNPKQTRAKLENKANENVFTNVSIKRFCDIDSEKLKDVILIKKGETITRIINSSKNVIVFQMFKFILIIERI